jgi:hypothetical protein
MRVVKALVAFMGVLIVIGIGLVAYGLSLDKNASDADGYTTPTTLTTPSVPMAGTTNSPTNGAATLAAFGDIAVDIAVGERLVGYEIDGNQASLHIEGPNGANARLVIVSLVSKEVLGQIILQTSTK